MHRKFLCLFSLLVCSVFALGIANSALADEFYKGKSIRFVVGFPPGGGYDTYTRAIARHMAKHVPGNPTVVVDNMPGSGSLNGANYIYNKAEPDGLTVGIWNSGLTLQQALGGEGIKFDALKVGWIGAPGIGMPTCAVMGFTGLKTWNDVINSKRPLKMGATGAGTVTSDTPKVLNLTIGTNFEVISELRGTPGIRLAMQKRKVDGTCFGWESMRSTARSMLDASGYDKLIPIITHGNPQDPEVRGLPQLRDVVKATAGAKGTAIVNAYLGSSEFMRPFSVPPGTPRDRLLTLRKAFKATLEDPAFLADARKSKLTIDYVSGEKIEKRVAEILGISAEVKEDLKFLLPESERVM